MSPSYTAHEVLVTGLGPITLCDTSQMPSKIGAEVKNFDLGDYVPREGALRHPMPRMVELALAAGVLARRGARCLAQRRRGAQAQRLYRLQPHGGLRRLGRDGPARAFTYRVLGLQFGPGCPWPRFA
jgi:hypothetical protein